MFKKTLGQSAVWNLERMFYTSLHDPKIETDMRGIERAAKVFRAKYENNRSWTSSAKKMTAAIADYEAMRVATKGTKPVAYLNAYLAINASEEAEGLLSLMQSRATKANDLISFFEYTIGTIPKERRAKILSSRECAPYKYFLERTFATSEHRPSVEVQATINATQSSGQGAWIAATQRRLNALTIEWKNETIPLTKAAGLLASLQIQSERIKIQSHIMKALATIADTAADELNAISTFKKGVDEIQKFKRPQDEMLMDNHDSPKTVDMLISVVEQAFPIAQKFYSLKKQFYGLDTITYADRAIKKGVDVHMSFDVCTEHLQPLLQSIDPEYATILNTMIAGGQIDVYPRAHKRGGGFCFARPGLDTRILLNHNDTYDSYRVYAHEMGHAIHFELLHAKQPTIYSNIGLSAAEVASTFFEHAASEKLLESLPESNRINALHDKCQESIQTIFRQVACYGLERDLHDAIRSKGRITSKEIAGIHNTAMKRYLGNDVIIAEEDGYSFVSWPHLRYFFYVYTYAFGAIVSRALYERCKRDSSYFAKVRQFMEAGASKSTADIFKDIGIDISKRAFYEEGIASIKNDVDEFEQLLNKRDSKIK